MPHWSGWTLISLSEAQCPNQVVERDGHKFKQFYGMSSSTAMQKHAGGVANYRASEGKTVEVGEIVNPSLTRHSNL